MGKRKLGIIVAGVLVAALLCGGGIVIARLTSGLSAAIGRAETAEAKVSRLTNELATANARASAAEARAQAAETRAGAAEEAAGARFSDTLAAAEERARTLAAWLTHVKSELLWCKNHSYWWLVHPAIQSRLEALFAALHERF